MLRREWMKKLALLLPFGIGAEADGIAEDIHDHALAVSSELEQLRVQLAGCGMAALGWHGECEPGSYGWSPAFEDTMILRQKFEAALRIVEERTPEGQTIALYPCGCSASGDETIPVYCSEHGQREYAARTHLVRGKCAVISIVTSTAAFTPCRSWPSRPRHSGRSANT